MEDLFKKFINAGVGFASLTSDRVQSAIDALVKESKLSEQEGMKIMDDLKKNSETKRKELEKQFSGIAAKLMKSVGVASNSDVEELKRSVKGGTKSSASKASAGKSGASKSSAKPAASATAKAAGTTKKAADKVSSAAGTAQKSAAAKAGAAKASTKPAARKDAPKASGSSAS